MGFCLQKLWGYWGWTRVWQERSWCGGAGYIGLEDTSASQPCLALAVGEIRKALCEGGNQSESLVFDFLIHRL